MWTKQTEAQLPNVNSEATAITPPPDPAASRPGNPTARSLSCVGSSLEIKGQITGTEDLRIDGKVEGPVMLRGQRLTVGHTGRLTSEIAARDIVVHGNITGNLLVEDRVEIRKEASVIGNIKAKRISIDDGARCRGRIEIDRGNAPATEPASTSSLVGLEVI